MSKPIEGQNILVRFEPQMIEQIDDYRFKHRFTSRTEAIRALVRAGLKQKPEKAKAQA